MKKLVSVVLAAAFLVCPGLRCDDKNPPESIDQSPFSLTPEQRALLIEKLAIYRGIMTASKQARESKACKEKIKNFQESFEQLVGVYSTELAERLDDNGKSVMRSIILDAQQAVDLVKDEAPKIFDPALDREKRDQLIENLAEKLDGPCTKLACDVAPFNVLSQESRQDPEKAAADVCDFMASLNAVLNKFLAAFGGAQR